MLTPSQWVILSIAIASLIVPFVIRLDEGSKPEPSITIDSSSPGSRSIRDILGALLLLLIMSGGVYAAFASKDPSRFRFAIFSPLLMALCLCVLLPQRIVDKVLMPVFRVYLVFIMALFYVGFLAILRKAFLHATVSYRSLGTLLTFSANEDPLMFWIYVFGSGFLAGLILTMSRLYIRQRIQRWRERKRKP